MIIAASLSAIPWGDFHIQKHGKRSFSVNLHQILTISVVPADRPRHAETLTIMKRLIDAFLNSRRALARAFRNEAALRQEIMLLLLGVPLSLVLTDDGWKRAALLGALLTLIAIELLNTGLEKLCDRLHPERHDDIGYVKDLGSAAVLMGICIAALVWLVALWQWLDRVL
jgi:diacylglycerol kinase (ATP)